MSERSGANPKSITVEDYRTDPDLRAEANRILTLVGIDPDDVESITIHPDRYVIHTISREIVDGGVQRTIRAFQR